MGERTTSDMTARTPSPLDPRLLVAVDRDVADARADRIADGMWGLRLPLPYALPRSVNAFLLDTNEGGLLIDCGTTIGVGWDGLVRALALAGSTPDRIATLLCTHLHTDHAAMADLVVARTGCRYLRGDGADVVNDRFRERTLAAEKRRAAARRAGVPEHELEIMTAALIAGDGLQPQPAPDGILREGDHVPTHVGDWEVIAVPGHSATQIALYEPRRRWLISADVAFPTGLPYIEYGFTPDPFAEHLAAIDRLAALPAVLVLAGHGPPDRAPGARFAAARENTLEWERRVRAALAAGETSAYGITCAINGDDPDPDLRQVTLSVVMAVLEHLVLTNDVDRTQTGPVDGYVLRAPASQPERA